jgi:hypothetical protein
MGVHERMTGAQRTAKYRAAKRAQGLRLKQIWLPDLSDPAMQEKLRRSAEIINERDRRDGTMEYLESLCDESMNALPSHDWNDDPAK